MSNKSERLKKLSEHYGLSGEDFHKIHNNIIVKRTGVEKIAAQANIDVKYELLHLDLKSKMVAVKATGKKTVMQDTEGEEGEPVETARTIETYGESCPYNTTNEYPLAMAEKRAFARAVLKLTEFYSHGVYSEDESDDFKK